METTKIDIHPSIENFTSAQLAEDKPYKFNWPRSKSQNNTQIELVLYLA